MSETQKPPFTAPENAFQLYLPIQAEMRQMEREAQEKRDKELEAKFPGLRRIFDKMLMTYAPPDIYRELMEDLIEFPIDAAIAIPFTYDKFPTMKIIGDGENMTNQHQNSLEHAEKIAIEKALKEADSKHLPPESMLLSTVEPCAMCASAFIHAGGKTIIYGASQNDLRGERVHVNHAMKPFRAEPKSYHVEEFIGERDPSIQIYGGYRKYEVLRHFAGSYGANK